MASIPDVDPPSKWATEDQQTYFGYLRRRKEAVGDSHDGADARRLSVDDVLKLAREIRAKAKPTERALARRRAVCEALYLPIGDAARGA